MTYLHFVAIIVGAAISVALEGYLQKFLQRQEYEKTNSPRWRLAKALILGVTEAAALGLPIALIASDLVMARSAALAFGTLKFAGSWETDNLLLKMVVIMLGIGTAVYIAEQSVLLALALPLIWLAIVVGFTYVLFSAISKAMSGKNKKS